MNDDYKSKLTITVENVAPKNYTIVKFVGDLDKAGLESIRTNIMKTVDDLMDKYLVFDFTDLDFINSESIGFLMEVHSHLFKISKNLVVSNAKANVKDVLSVIGIFNIIQYTDSLDTLK